MEGSNNGKAETNDLADQSYRPDGRGESTGLGMNRSMSRSMSLMSSYGGTSSNGYDSYGEDSYGGYGTGYNSYGTGYSSYGRQNSYGGYSSYGRGRMGTMGYSSVGQRQQPGPMDPNRPMQRPPITFREDIWGFLNGAHSILNVLYAGSGILAFGNTFLKTTVTVTRFLTHKSLGLLLRLTGIHYFKKLMLLTKGPSGDWATELSDQKSMGDAWEGKSSRFGLKKLFFILRLVALAGVLLSWVMKRREQKKMQQYMNMKKAIEEKIAKINEHIQATVVEENFDDSMSQEPEILMSEAENQLLNQAYNDAKEEIVAIAEKPEEEETDKLANETNTETVEVLAVSESEKTNDTTTVVQAEEIVKSSLNMSDSAIARVVENTSEVQEVQASTEVTTSQPQNTNETLTVTIESEPVVESKNQTQDNQANCQSEEYWKSKGQNEAFLNQVENTATQPVSLGLEKEDPFFPSMLRQASSKPKETSKALPWLKRAKTTVAP